ncbi:MAG: hypothetical protein QOH25_3793 [Acidobacteriota bacterium]|nr:hypothetical protein [Acidobacteriota bacterium]
MRDSLLFSRPSGTQLLSLLCFPALKCWAIVTLSLRDKKHLLLSNSLVSYYSPPVTTFADGSNRRGVGPAMTCGAAFVVTTSVSN